MRYNVKPVVVCPVHVSRIRELSTPKVTRSNSSPTCVKAGRSRRRVLIL